MVEHYYDEEQDILSIDLSKNSHHSIPVGGLVIDVNNEGELASLEIFKASESLARYTDISKKEAEKVLKNIGHVEVESTVSQGMMSIVIDFTSSKDEKLKMPINVEAPA